MLKLNTGLSGAAGILALVLLSSCKTKPPPSLPPPPPPKPVIAHVSAVGSDQLNPDGSSRPSPVVLRLFLLHSSAEFNEAGFGALYDKEQETLGASLLGHEQTLLHPGETWHIDLQMNANARFIGVLAGFRDQKQWHALTAVPTTDGIPTLKSGVVTIHVEKNVVTIDPIE
jgi:type VI secretion system protein VasD